MKRLLYFNSAGKHDVRFFKRAPRITDRWKILFVTMKPELADQMAELGIESRCLRDDKYGYDDWDRAHGYGFYGKWRLKRAFEVYRSKFRAILDQYKPDLVHSGWIQTDGYLAALEKRCPLIVMALGSDAMVRPYDNEQNRQKTIWTMRQADLLYGDSIAVEQSMKNLLGEDHPPIFTHPKGIDRSVFHPEGRTDTSGVRIVIAKNFVPVSRFDTLTAALNRAQDIKQKFSVDIYGDGMLFDEVSAQVRACDLGSATQLHGRVDNTLLPDIYRSADYFLSCNESEGTSFALMEAMSCGVIPIVTDLPAYSAFITSNENGFIFPVGDDQKLADILRRVVALDADTLHDMRQRNVEIAAKWFDADVSFERLVAWYDKLVP